MTVLGIREDTSLDPADHLAEALRSSRMLLILNNCEHLIEQTATLTARLLRTAPDLRVLVTSREPLALAGECLWPVSPLELPDRTASMEHYTDFAERAAPHLRGHDQRSWLRRLDVEAANLRRSLDSAIQDSDLRRRISERPSVEPRARRIRAGLK